MNLKILHNSMMRQNISLGLLTSMYVKQVAINYQIAKWTRTNKHKLILDKVIASDIAYSIIVYENTKEVWEEKYQSSHVT